MSDEIDENWLGEIRKVAFAGDGFEPFPRMLIAAATLDRFVDLGLVEAGPSRRPAVAAVGYRLTPEGQDIACKLWTCRHSTLSQPSREAA